MAFLLSITWYKIQKDLKYLKISKKFIMGKPSKKSCKSSHLRKKARKVHLIKSFEKEIADLQIQMIDFEKLVTVSGERVVDEIKKCSWENNNLIEWLKIYDE